MTDKSVDDDLPDMGEIYQAVSHILSLVVHYGKTLDDEQPEEACKDGDLRDWAVPREKISRIPSRRGWSDDKEQSD